MANAKPEIKKGKYRHYKGKDYEVFGLVRHSETEEWLVHYRTLYGDFSQWVRPYEMFVGTAMTEKGMKPRFEYLGSSYSDEPGDDG